MREVALLALMRGVPHTAKVLGLEERQIQEWMKELKYDDPFFDSLRSLVWENIKQHGIEETAKQWKVSTFSLEKLKSYYESHPDHKPIITPDCTKPYHFNADGSLPVEIPESQITYKPSQTEKNPEENKNFWFDKEDMELDDPPESSTSQSNAISFANSNSYEYIKTEINNYSSLPEINDMFEEWYEEDDYEVYVEKFKVLEEEEEGKVKKGSAPENEVVGAFDFIGGIATVAQPEKDHIDAATKLMIVGEALKEGGGKFAATANKYGINRKQLRKWVLKFQTSGNVFPTTLTGKAPSETLQAVAKEFLDSEDELTVL
ncbi:unnamed protein product [Blepharisma stoltei]|uniref:Helix-turn-helix domain-containing protein n=1 Tax=Blepharisma stoltei TaxID=1481888 RepID=A0AAU9J2D4_9CILI|nr:unnamed protein product [Blepharisma stoltei]